MSDNQQNRQAPKTTYTSAEFQSYERQFTALAFTLANGRGLINLSPIFDEFVGKDPKRGDSVYDYEDKMNFLIDAQAAIQLRSGLNQLMENIDDMKSMTISFGNEKTRRTISVFAPNTLKLAGKSHDNFLLRLTHMKDDSEEKKYHLMQRASVDYKNRQNESLTDPLEVDMLLLVEFCNVVIENAFNGAYHGAKRNSQFAPSGGGRSSAPKSRREVEEESDDADEAPAASKATGGKNVRKTSMTDEFKDD